MTEIGALVCEAILNFDEDENETITSPASLRILAMPQALSKSNCPNLAPTQLLGKT